MTSTASAQTDRTVTVRYDLFDLPTAQHKAGLAGLILQIRSMQARKFGPEHLPVIEELTPTSATVTFTAGSVQALFDDVYAAKMVEVTVAARWPNQQPKREEEVEETDPETQKTRRVRRFVYEVVQPSGHFLRDSYPDEDGKWLKLWRDMLWAIPRGIPKTRLPFQQRAEGKPCKEGQTAWKNLVAAEKARQGNAFHTDAISSALWLGAQESNAEMIPFQGRAEQNLLLHFWPLTVLVFVPQQVSPDGSSAFVGYALVIPEVSHLVNFCDEYPEMLHDLDPTVRGFRPAEAVIDLPEQGALDFLEHLARLAERKTAGRSGFIDSVSAAEFLHLVKTGNTIKLMASGRVAPRPELLDQYLAVVGRAGQPSPFRNPLFRRGLLLSLLHGRPWYAALGPLLRQWPWAFFVRDETSPRQIPWFWTDAATKFQQEAEADKHQREVQKTMSDTNRADQPGSERDRLPVLIHQLIRNYVLRRTEEKSGLKWNDIKDRKTPDGKIDVPAAWNEAKEKAASDAFLAARSRREQDFVDFFTATFCSVKQYLPEADFRAVAEALLTRQEDVKTLTLLALSANS